MFTALNVFTADTLFQLHRLHMFTVERTQKKRTITSTAWPTSITSQKSGRKQSSHPSHLQTMRSLQLLCILLLSLFLLSLSLSVHVIQPLVSTDPILSWYTLLDETRVWRSLSDFYSLLIKSKFSKSSRNKHCERAS